MKAREWAINPEEQFIEPWESHWDQMKESESGTFRVREVLPLTPASNPADSDVELDQWQLGYDEGFIKGVEDTLRSPDPVVREMAEAVRKVIPPEAFYPKNEGTGVHRLAVALAAYDAKFGTKK